MEIHWEVVILHLSIFFFMIFMLLVIIRFLWRLTLAIVDGNVNSDSRNRQSRLLTLHHWLDRTGIGQWLGMLTIMAMLTILFKVVIPWLNV